MRSASRTFALATGSAASLHSPANPSSEQTSYSRSGSAWSRGLRWTDEDIDELGNDGAPIAVWCFGPVGNLPLGDVMLTQKLALETNEQAALAVANRFERRR